MSEVDDVVTESGGDGAEVLSWIESFGTGTENDTMLRFTPSQHNAVDLTDANSSGLMQLLGGRRTRLSTLLNDSAVFTPAAKAAANIRAKIREMRDDRGIETGYMACGIASWTEHDASGGSTFTAPVMLIPVTLGTRSDSGDYDLQFTGPARLNPALARHMATVHGVVLSPEEFYAAGYVTARFDYQRTSALLQKTVSAASSDEQTQAEGPAGDLESLQVWNQIYVSTFADLADLGNPQTLSLDHPVISAMAAGEPLGQRDAEEAQAAMPAPDDRAPETERLVTDADADQQEALDAIMAGTSVVVSAPPGTGQTQTAVNAAAGLAWAGRRVLVVAERTGTLSEFSRRLSAAKLGTLAVHVPAAADPSALRDQVIRAIKRAERAEPPRLSAVHRKLTSARHQLRDHVASLHKVRDRWSCSPYQAMQALAALTSLNPAPATSVRLRRSVLDNTVERSPAAVKLKRAAELGAFSESTRTSPWFDARLSNRQETKDAHDLVKHLRDELPELKAQMENACRSASIRMGDSFADWHAQVLLFQQVQESLGKFSHDVYARDVHDLIAATAPGWWRRQHGVEMSSMNRSRLRRVAKEYIRPGVSINDLHGSLVDVQAERESWLKHAQGDSLPKVPPKLDALVDGVGEVQTRLQKLVSGLAPAGEDEQTLFDLPAEELFATVEALAEDERSLHTLPERTLLTEQLREQGFGELIDDFASREVESGRVADELELAWWQSALEAMISGDEYLAMTAGENLRTIEAEFAEADAAHIATGAQRLTHDLATRWKAALEDHPEEAGQLRGLLKNATPSAESLQQIPASLVQPLVPLWTTSPLGLAEHLPAGSADAPGFDAVILLDAETLAVPAALGAISRADQVVAFGDPVSGAPKPLAVSADPIARAAEAHVPGSICTELARVLPVHRLRQVHRGVDQELTALLSDQLYDGDLVRLPDASQLTGLSRRVSVEHVSAAASGGRETVESPTAEVNRVVDLVFEHVRRNRNRSLAVVTGSAWHAQRVADAIRLHLANHAWASSFFEHGAAGVPGGSGAGAAGEGTGESFVVAPVERAHAVVRDDVIFSLGFGRTPQGKPAAELGELSGPRGREYFAQAVTRARGRLTVVVSLSADELRETDLDQGAALLPELLSLQTDSSEAARGSDELTDPLVLDLVDRIRARGGRVEDAFRGTMDLAACPRKISPAAQVTPVAMISDGTAAYAAQSVRERSRLIPQRFRSLGWECMVLWTIEVFSDPRRITELVAEKVGLSSGPEFAEGGRARLPRLRASAGTGPLTFGGAADASNSSSRVPQRQWLSPRQRGNLSR